MSRIAVVGGGISGLAAAHRLTELDMPSDVVVFESGDRTGGVLATESVDGFRIESGPDSMLSQLPWGIDLCRRIGFTDRLVGTSDQYRQTWIVRSGRLLALPDGLAIMAPSRIWPTVRSPILSVLGKLRLACEPFVSRRSATTDESLADFACRRVGREAFERLVQPLVSGIYMADPRQLSIRAALPRFVEMESKHGSLIRAARRAARNRKSAPTGSSNSALPTSMFVAPRDGMGSLASALTERLPPESIRLRTNVKQLSRKPEGGWRLSGDCDSNGFDENFDAVIVAAPSSRAAHIVRETDASLADELSQIQQSGCVVVTLAFAREDVAHPLNGYGFVVPQVEQRDIIACTFSSVKYENRAPEGQVLLRVFLGGATRPELMELDDEAVLSTVLRELEDLLGIQGRPSVTRIVRWPNIMPQYHVGHLDRIERIEAAVATIPYLELAGNSYRGVGIPHCIRSGEQAAERIAQSITSA
ncbi:MAG: protoporphyrinogen oxidase [Fuerstiella sp.]|nr:protoporphyrinogen oxidase [Fuerstiella sp.]MCP4853244.1 protoporphyrinogen oxidase [Fuerstiella sp.]